jgi:glutamate-1-semialdehyde aminotransferase
MFGETLSLAASIATIKKMERENVVDHLRDIGLKIFLGWADIMQEVGLPANVMSLRGTASFQRIKFRDEQIAALFRKEMIASGTLIVGSNNVCYAMREPEIKRILKSYRHALGVMRDALDKGNIEQRLAGATVAPMVRAS